MYKIEKYKELHKEGVVKLLADLWGDTKEESILRFEMKYEQNPYDSEIYSIVALHNDKVVGYRGLIPSKWTISGKSVWFLLLADTNVHIEHRRKGLFKKMTQKSIELLQGSKFSGYLSLSSNQLSYQGNLKLGWRKICKKDYTRLTSIMSLLLFVFKIKPLRKISNKIEIINVVNNAVCSPLSTDYNSDKIRISEIEKLYSYKVLRHNYKCFKYIENNESQAYVTIAERNNNTCTILDFNYKSEDFLEKLINELRKKYHVISVLKVSINKKNIKKTIITQILDKVRNKSSLDILYRPIKPNYTDKDFYINGKNLLDANTWNFKEIVVE